MHACNELDNLDLGHVVAGGIKPTTPTDGDNNTPKPPQNGDQKTGGKGKGQPKPQAQ